MLRRLASVRRRVDRLATEARVAGCAGHHRRVRVVDVFGDDPTPPWPEAERGGRCACGAKLVSCPSGSRNKLRGLGAHGALCEASDARQDVIGGFGPDERLGIRVMRVDEVANGCFQL